MTIEKELCNLTVREKANGELVFYKINLIPKEGCGLKLYRTTKEQFLDALNRYSLDFRFISSLPPEAENGKLWTEDRIFYDRTLNDDEKAFVKEKGFDVN